MPPVVLHFQRGTRSEDLGDLVQALHHAGFAAIREALPGAGYLVIANLPNPSHSEAGVARINHELRLAGARWAIERFPDNLNPEMRAELAEDEGEGRL